ncbi:MAG: hypothetical protein U5L72_19880 [Bacteroidales bacterium]|nr:hypothetical protein [Bacteroidales bacterium]
MLEALGIYRDEGVWLEITNLVVPGWTDKPDEIRQMCSWLPVTVSPTHPIALQPCSSPSTSWNTCLLRLLQAYWTKAGGDSAAGEGLKYVYLGNMPGAGY